MMTKARQACPDWLDYEARNEWNRLIGDDLIGHDQPEALAVYSFVFSLRHRVRAAVDTLRTAGRNRPSSPERQRLVSALTDLDERLTTDLMDLSTTLGIQEGKPGQRRPTRILILDEGVADTSD